MNITTIKQITSLAIYGALTGLVIVSCLSGWSWVSRYSAMNGDFQFTFSNIVGVIISAFGLFFAGALYGIRDKQDWIVPAMILGAAAGPFFFSSFERRYQKNFLVGLVLLTVIGVFFGGKEIKACKRLTSAMSNFALHWKSTTMRESTHICHLIIGSVCLSANFQKQ